MPGATRAGPNQRTAPPFFSPWALSEDRCTPLFSVLSLHLSSTRHLSSTSTHRRKEKDSPGQAPAFYTRSSSIVVISSFNTRFRSTPRFAFLGTSSGLFAKILIPSSQSLASFPATFFSYSSSRQPPAFLFATCYEPSCPPFRASSLGTVLRGGQGVDALPPYQDHASIWTQSLPMVLEKSTTHQNADPLFGPDTP